MKLIRLSFIITLIFLFLDCAALYSQKKMPGEQSKGAQYTRKEQILRKYWHKKLVFSDDEKLIIGKAESYAPLTKTERIKANHLVKKEKNAKRKLREIDSNHYYYVQSKEVKKRIKETKRKSKRHNKGKHPKRFVKTRNNINKIFKK